MLPSLATFLLLVIYVDARSSYTNLIPNGNNVPNPCGIGVWNAVGHSEPSQGTGFVNQFGRDFAAAGRRWTGSLCQKDSDGDGRTNGDELGDPQCVWTRGSLPARTTDLGHPGICEPVASDLCKAKNTFLTAKNCGALEDDVTSFVPHNNHNNKSGEPAITRPTHPPRGPPPSSSSAPSTARPEGRERSSTTTSNRNNNNGRVMSTTPRVKPTTQPPKNPWQLMRNCVCYCLDMAGDIFGETPYDSDSDDWSDDDDEDYEYDNEEEDDYYYYNGYDDDDDQDRYYYRGSNNYYPSSVSNNRGNGRGRTGQQQQDSNGRGRARTSQQRGQQNSNSNNNRPIITTTTKAPPRGVNNNNNNNRDHSNSYYSSSSYGNNNDNNRYYSRYGDDGGYYGSSSGGGGGNSGYYNGRSRDRYGDDNNNDSSNYYPYYMPPPVGETPEFNDTNHYYTRRPCTCACQKL